jgi:hypothetical protein
MAIKIKWMVYLTIVKLEKIPVFNICTRSNDMCYLVLQQLARVEVLTVTTNLFNYLLNSFN